MGDEVVVTALKRLFDDRRYQVSLRHREYAVFPGDTAFAFIRNTNVGRLFVQFGWAAALDSILRGS